MENSDSLLIFGASTRAAAFSAIRAGLRPWCADLFADQDLHARCQVTRIAARDYPHHFVRLAAENPAGPWMYTGSLENSPRLIGRIARNRRLWGNGEDSLRRARSPEFLVSLFSGQKLPFARIHPACAVPPRDGAWLSKPRHGATGREIHLLTAREDGRRANYCQEFIEGEPFSAIYVGDGYEARLAGVTRQLVGESWLNAGQFQYCGSIGPVSLTNSALRCVSEIGNAIAAGCGLRGLFGMDYILKEETPYPVEVNPRYTASVEVMEYATRWPALAEHRAVFEGSGPKLAPIAPVRREFVGKAIYFAKEALAFPYDGPWTGPLCDLGAVHEMPAFADIPQAGELIERGSPILSFFVRGASVSSCSASLREIARDLDHRLFGR